MKKITEVIEDINSVVLKKGSKNTYNWEIKVYGESLCEIVDKINIANKELIEEYSE